MDGIVIFEIPPGASARPTAVESRTRSIWEMRSINFISPAETYPLNGSTRTLHPHRMTSGRYCDAVRRWVAQTPRNQKPIRKMRGRMLQAGFTITTKPREINHELDKGFDGLSDPCRGVAVSDGDLRTCTATERFQSLCHWTRRAAGSAIRPRRILVCSGSGKRRQRQHCRKMRASAGACGSLYRRRDRENFQSQRQWEGHHGRERLSVNSRCNG